MDVNITYETLFDTLRKEKSSEELQELEMNFYDDANKYLSEKYETFNQNQDLKTNQQIHNIKKILKEIFERRQKKILILAFNQGRTKNQLATTRLLKEEKYFFDAVLESINKYNGLLEKTMIPKTAVNESEKSDFKMQETVIKPESDSVKVKFLTKLPKFLGKDLESYGPYEKGEEANLPSQLANILIDKKRAIKS